MLFEEFTKVSINSFLGLFNRGGTDEVPIDHASDLQNVSFTKKAEVTVRPGTNLSITSSSPVVRQFLSTVNGVLLWLTCDGAGNIIRQDTGATFLTVTNMVDFAALNIFGKTFIAPILSAFSATNYIYVYDGTNPPRPMAGLAPSSSFTAAESATSGNVSPGVHLYALSYITDTGYTTAPGPVLSGTFTPVSLLSTGGFSVDLSGIPLGPTGTVARQILVTKSGLTEFFYSVVINDNTTTAITISFFDTDLAVSADSLFDLYIPISGVGFGGMALAKYSGRMVVVSGDFVFMSNSGDAESFSSITAALSIPSENDGNSPRAACELFGVLYIIKAVGIFSAQDNGGDPNTWTISSIDGAIGSYQSGIGTIVGSQSALSFNSIILLANRAGLWLFNGNVGRPELSYKITSLWGTVNPNAENQISVAIDTFNNLLYVLLATGSSSTPNLCLVGDYSEGLTPDAIKWSKYVFPWTPISIQMINVNDGNDFVYQLRLGTSTNIYKLHPKYTADYSAVPIVAYYTSFAACIGQGCLNVFRYLKLRIKGSGNLAITLYDIDGANAATPPVLALASTPSKELGREINFMNEKMLVKIGLSTLNSTFTLSRLDIFGKIRFMMRPNG